MTDMLDLLRTRRSVPSPMLGAPAPSGAELEALLSIASRVPDHGKLAPWRFILIEGDARHRIGQVIAGAFAADNPDASGERLAAERKRLAHAPLVIAVVSRARPHVKIPEWEQILSAGAVCMNLVVAANAAGYATSWLTEWYAFDRRVLDALGLEPHERIAGFIHVGTATEKPSDRPRPALADIVTRYEG
ncbi:nitroreductase [Chelatococcus sp. SYSU_G07232]|uniref:Putative NAD(P)H nitroreductase n=1 Tax=Chelatococcus albus TaxID=3047466 RepID=A0ABT7AJ17_9HYPH|nr:nitroreductase [Chelatococcus sp. SYSU_G07232]MDJ1159378.1 nitroreductase [Chelatococcus sp. SYSU_G07232]